MRKIYNNYYQSRGCKINYQGMWCPLYIQQVLPKNRNSRILDIGCGTGDFLYALKMNGYKNLLGIDMDEKSVKVVNGRGIKCVCQDVMQYHPKEKYDVITLHHVLEHIEKKEVLILLEHINKELLADKGMLIIRVPNAQSCTGCYWAYEDFTHVTLYTAGSLKFILKNIGFRKIEFLDKDGTSENKDFVKKFKQVCIHLYDKKLNFQNFILGGAFHKPSPRIYTWEIKVLARK